MILRCRWCERGYCEDCLDWDNTDLIGDNLPEYELLGFPAVTQAFYIRCPACVEHHAKDPGEGHFCENQAKQFEAQYRQMLDEKTALAAAAAAADAVTEVLEEEEPKKGVLLLPSSRAESLTDATTLNDSGISTPKVVGEVVGTCSVEGGKKRKALREAGVGGTPSKKVKARVSTFGAGEEV